MVQSSISRALKGHGPSEVAIPPDFFLRDDRVPFLKSLSFSQGMTMVRNEGNPRNQILSDSEKDLPV